MAAKKKASKKKASKTTDAGVIVTDMSDEQLRALRESIFDEETRRQEQKLGEQAKPLKKEYDRLVKLQSKDHKVKFSLMLPIDFELHVEMDMSGEPSLADSKTKLNGDFTKKQRQWLAPAIQEAVDNACESIFDIMPEEAHAQLAEAKKLFTEFEKRVKKETGMEFYEFEDVVSKLSHAGRV
jgi:Holliday junction resolvase RusA-like endonuclease